MKKICRNCKQPSYKCSCGETDLVDAAFAVAEGIILADVLSDLFSSDSSGSSASDSSSSFDGFGGGDFGGGGASSGY